MSEAKKTVENLENGGEVAEQPKIVRSKLHVDSWRKRLFHDGFSRDGKRILSSDWSVRLAHGGRRVTFNLDTPNAATAATKAQQIYAKLISSGWDATIAKFKPESLPKKRAGTVGQAIAAATEISTVRQQSLAQSALRLRQIAAEIASIPSPTITREVTTRRGMVTKTISARSAYRSEAFKAWRAKVDAVPLSILTADAVRGWRAQRIALRSASEIDKQAANISADSTIRMARAVFSGELLENGLASRVELPTPLPFAGVKTGDSTKRFTLKIDVAALFASARAELEVKQPEQFRALVLCVNAGLRRREADLLEWGQVDLVAQSIELTTTTWLQPKSDESTRRIDLDDVVVEILRRAKSDNPDPRFVLKGGAPRLQTKAATVYRCDAAPWKTWIRLAEWLRAHGVNEAKPIHALRKLAGSLVFAAHGIEQARDFLGHASITTTSASYVVNRKRVTASIPAQTDEVSAVRKEAGRA